MCERLDTYRRIRELGLSASLTGTGHHRVNYVGGKERTARYAATLEEALEVAQALADGRPTAAAPRPCSPTTRREPDEATRAAAVGVLRAARSMVQSYSGTAVPDWLRQEAEELVRAIQQGLSVLLMALTILGLLSAPPGVDEALAAQAAAKWVAEKVSQVANTVAEAVQAVEGAVEAVRSDAGAAIRKAASDGHPHTTTRAEAVADVVGDLIEANRGRPEEAPAVQPAEPPSEDVAVRQPAADGQPDALSEGTAELTYEPSDEPW